MPGCILYMALLFKNLKIKSLQSKNMLYDSSMGVVCGGSGSIVHDR